MSAQAAGRRVLVVRPKVTRSRLTGHWIVCPNGAHSGSLHGAGCRGYRLWVDAVGVALELSKIRMHSTTWTYDPDDKSV